jgi:hypothetical protein
VEASKKHKIINRLISISLISQVLISRPAWESSLREFPTAPVFKGLNWGVLGSLMFVGLLTLLIALVIKPLNRVLIVSVVVLLFLLVLEDQSRLQPWVFLYGLILMATVFYRGEDLSKKVLATVLMILGATYFWGGVQKINPFFGIEMFPWLSEFAASSDFFGQHPQIAYISTGLETLAGLALFFRQSRKLAALTLLGLHAFILISLGPFGHNWNHVIWPWNICFASFLLLLIWFQDKEKEPLPSLMRSRYFLFCFVLVGCMPALSIFDKWDHFLSGGFYSATAPEAIFYYHENEQSRMASSSTDFQYFNKGENEEFVLIDQWALDHLGLPLYPEIRVQKQVGKHWCDCMAQPEYAGLRINRKNRFTGESETIEIPCAEL